MTPDSECRSLRDALLNFDWNESPEGCRYWLKQYQKQFKKDFENEK